MLAALECAVDTLTAPHRGTLSHVAHIPRIGVLGPGCVVLVALTRLPGRGVQIVLRRPGASSPHLPRPRRRPRGFLLCRPDR